jgi:hypothetical protein
VSTDQAWADLAGSLPVHQGELMASHEGRPTVAVQDQNNGRGLPPVDRGDDTDICPGL